MLNRIDVYPTRRYGEFWLRPGRPYPFGATIVPGGVNFAVFSRHGTQCWLVLWRKGERTPLAEIPFFDAFRIGHVWAMVVFGLEHEEIEYGYRMDGPHRPHAGHRFDARVNLLDPYARAIGGRDVWAAPADPTNPQRFRGRVLLDDFDWQDDRQLEIPAEDLIIYEMHVRGFTRHPLSGSRFPGTFAAIRDKIPYLLELGVNAVELMPIQEFDELESNFFNPYTGQRLVNYWGYSTVGFFAPKPAYAATGHLGMEADELKALVKLLHRNGIEIILDVVFNHTAEGNAEGTTISFRGLDNRTYYMLTPDGSYYNFSGCGNTLNCNNPVVRNLVLDALRYWVSEYHIDGFRFDLASILGRDAEGHPLSNPPLLESLAHDPVLGKTKLIAEAWDAGGLYQVGSFPAYGRWAEWNGRYRDALRRFLKGDLDQVAEMGQMIKGSPHMYLERGPTASINFVTCHDGFTLNDLVSYAEKHNLANGENNQDGANDNHSWNWGHEGPTDDPAIMALRRRLMRNAIAILMVSQGVPMILMGDEMAHTKQGNNNTYAQDNELNWIDWGRLAENADLFRFFRYCIAFRKAHPALRRRYHLHERDLIDSGFSDISWHGLREGEPDWSPHSRTLAFMLCGMHAALLPGRTADDYIYVALNMHWEPHTFELPRLRDGRRWYRFADTFRPSPDDIYEPGHERPLRTQRNLPVGPRSVVILVGR
ncbi:glycogen debranching protein GlgX [Promineifilum sp.]|uniref:glycogen debranching protein GlgX n=1 Tax=Promineifilum sp. TaxID=2664178 RepID=UPI0035B4F755